MRQYGAATFLYIGNKSLKSLITLILDDRLLVVEPGEEYLGWVIVCMYTIIDFKLIIQGALSTCVGTYLSTHKANLKTPKPVFGKVFKL